MMKKFAIQAVVLAVFFSVSLNAALSNATTTTSVQEKDASVSSYDPVTFDSSINFSATKQTDGTVKISWSKYAHAENFSFYKVVRAQDVTSPVYPDDGYIYFTSDISELSYTDANAPVGNNYYRICEIASPKRYCSTKVVAVVIASRPAVPVKMLKGFSDVPTDAWYAQCVAKLADRGIVSSGNSQSFRAEMPVNRAEFMKLILEAYYPLAAKYKPVSCYSDVTSDWYNPYVCYAKSKAFVIGYDGGKAFHPAQSITRAESISILDRILNIPVVPGVNTGFNDVYDQWQKDVIQGAVKLKLVNGYSSTKFGPNDTLQRAQAAKIICNAIESKISVSGTPAVAQQSTQQPTMQTTSQTTQAKTQAMQDQQSSSNPDGQGVPATTNQLYQGNDVPMI